MNKLLLTVAIALTAYTLSAQAPGGVSAGLNVWLKADAGTSSTTDAAFLTSWNDQSPNGNHATQNTQAAKPQYYSNQMNGNPAVRTTGPRYMNLNLQGIINSNFTVFTVAKRMTNSSSQYTIGVQQPGANVGFRMGYTNSTFMKLCQYGNVLSSPCAAYGGANEIPGIMTGEYSMTTGKKLSLIQDGVNWSRVNVNTTHYAMTGQGNVGRGSDASGFYGIICEVIVYNRTLSTAEKQQVQTYLSVKYGLSILTTDHLYYNEPLYPNDVFGIGKNLASQGLNQTVSNSSGPDDILELRDASTFDDGDYMICGNNNGAVTFSPYVGPNNSISNLMNRVWKTRVVGTPGTVTMKFDMTGITGWAPDQVMLMIDSDGDGFDDETGINGTYSAPYYTFTGVTVPTGSRFTLGGRGIWYAVNTGNASGAIWAPSPNGTPQTITSACTTCHLIVKSGVNVTNDWPTASCKNFEIQAGGIFNAGTGSLTVSSTYNIAGTFNAQTSSVTLNGTQAQTITGSGIANVYNLTVNNAAGVTISPSSGGVHARNLITMTAGTLTTNNKLFLDSDASSTGMIGPLTTGMISGNVSIQRYHHAASQGWVNLTCPIQGKTIADWNDDLITTGFAGSDYPPPYAFNNIQYYFEPTAGGIDIGFVGATNVTNALTPRLGYMAFMNAGIMNLDVDGALYTGSQVMPVSYTNTGNPSGDGWNMLGNPYPCTIDWDAGAWSKSNVNNAVYVWNAALGQYASYVNGVATNGGSRYIPSSQSFFVMTNNVNPTLTLNENCKATVQGTFKSTENPQAVFTLNISNELYSDETTFARHDNGTMNFDMALDAYKLRSPLTNVPYMSSISDEGSDLSVNAFATISHETIIPIRIETGVSGSYILTHSGLNSFAQGACIVLEDFLTNTIYPLNQFDEIVLDLEAGNQDLRFQLRVGGTSMSSITSSGCPGLENGTATINVDENGPYNITWMDAEGTPIVTTIGATTSDEISGLGTGMYFVRIENNGACGTTETNFFITHDEPIIANAIVAPTSCQNTEDGGIALNLMGGSEPYIVQWSDGSKSQSLDQLGSDEYTAFVTDVKGCTNSFTFNVPVASPMSSNFETQEETYEMLNGAVVVDFYNTSENADDFTWNFGDISQDSYESNPSHLFNEKGVYTVSLLATDGNCESYSTKTIKITNAKSEGTTLSSEIIGTLTDNGVQLMFFFPTQRKLQINAYNILGQQLIEPINGVYERQTITFSDRRYASNALIEIVDMNTGERALLKMGR